MRRIVMLLIVAALCAPAVFASGQAEATAPAAQTIVMRLAETHSQDYPTTQGNYHFAELVEQRTDGRIRIEVYHSAQLGE